MPKIFEKQWDHKKHEAKLYQTWEKSGYFKPEVNMSVSPLKDTENNNEVMEQWNNEVKPFVIATPPPNVTGQLHIGHVLGATMQDIMIRYHRLLGDPALAIPGTDHAGIATQTVVDKMLKKQGINRYEIGRERFLEHVWEWKEKFGGKINQQLRAVGSSCDWSRERFTLDPGMSRAVNEAFVDFYNKGLIYRGEYIVNWCPKCGTAIADDEVEYKEQKAKLYYFKYDKNFPITIATTRPETKFGDVAVAVNPNDERYKEFVGKSYQIDLDGVKCEIKVIADRSVDSTYGSGAVGVTPSHSAVDWRMAEEHSLPRIKVIDERGKMTPEAGEKYQGLKAIEAREKLLGHLRENDLLEKEVEFDNNLSVCYRCSTAIEPIPSLQWFVKMKPLAEKAKKAVESGEIEIIPKRFEKVYYHWMDNIRDWCISRQLWWGHRIPVYYRKQEISKSEFLISNEIQNSKSQNDVIAREKIPHNFGTGSAIFNNKEIAAPPTKGMARNDNSETIQQLNNDSQEIYVGIEPPQGDGWVQDEDVLDTWFSSGLWPFSTLGWPHSAKASRGKPGEKTHPFPYAPGITNKDYEYFYPTAVMETGYDILFFWVARMIMMGLELTGKVPFETVYLHGLVRDEKNRKMSKSLGNGIDPLEIIDKYGADALRMALVVGSTPGQDIPVGENKIRGYRNFSNKIWNASRFVALRVSEGDLREGEMGEYRIKDTEFSEDLLTDADKEVLKVHQIIKSKVKKYLDEFKFSLAGETLYEYFWHEFCDVYIEQAKGQLQTGELLVSPLKDTVQDTDNNETMSRSAYGGKQLNNGESVANKEEIATNTKKVLIKVLSETLLMLHPFVPYVTEAVWQELRGIYPALSESIMIAEWPLDTE